ncbi:MAG: amino acid adenylation domain-containing protein, partial [Mizugakiibacter sp.]|uniref:non-ribosomal peptide synthetase n=1 Tax=Mizugakiibacter sp. TaxID=1972610 RepID=UPI00320F0B9D
MTTHEPSAAPSGVGYDPFAGAALARVVPTTEPQREVWLADRLGREASLAYNESVSLRLRGRPNVDALRAALQELVDRHEALRSTIGPGGEELCVAERIALELPLIDLSGRDVATREAALADARRRAVETPFDLERGPLFRAELLRLAADDHVLILTAHHIVCDGWSFAVLVRDLAALYGGWAAGAPPALPPADAFADYALAQAALASAPQFAEDERYWLQRYAGPLPVLELPTDRPRPARRTFASGREDLWLDAELIGALKRLGARRGASLFATLLSGFAALLQRLGGQDDVVIGIPAAGQAVGGHDALVGHCVNLLPLRTTVDADAGFGALLDAMKATVLDAYEHQQYTFGTLLRKLPLARDPSRLPLVSVLFNLDQALDGASTPFAGLDFEFAANARSYENFELFVNAAQVGGGIRLECQYNRDLFDAASVRRWLRGYAELLRAAAVAPDTVVGRLPIVDADALADLRALQPAPTPYDPQRLAHAWFEAQAERTPARAAVRHGETRLSYAELDARANRIAHALRARGVRRGALVGLAVERGADMVAAVLGALKAGAGYVPLDPGFPAERLAYMVRDAALRVLVTQSALAERFAGSGAEPLLLDDTALDALPTARLPRDDAAATPDSVCYVIYTSGSTGQPKGVLVPHRTTANFIAGMQRTPGIDSDDVLLAVTTLSFDIAFMELMLPLSVGAEVVVAGRDTARDGAALRRLLETCGATMMQATPAGWRILLESGWAGRPGFRAVSGGEPLAPDLAEALLARCGEVWNGYGPTETTVYSTYWRVRDPRAGIAIGTPIANTQVWVLDAQRQPCPIGVPGELWIGGDGVALGYLNRAELTAERFLPDPFRNAPGARLYRTGDRGRWKPDGTLEHLGRL